ncbi:type II secretion system protein GspE [Candidatus Gracilibacteria bacterium]|nr:MAG: type II secretion system protein GspE [Candidatus Gracilibacteria bacterium]PIE85263.1 MAG: type II secretion system protein GspE [Candidatus Gracilibacteria bacterium]
MVYNNNSVKMEKNPVKIVDEMELKKDLGDVVQYIDGVFLKAIQMKASDIHVEPTENYLLIRFRVDGDFHILDKISNENVSAIITRLKVLARVKIDENKKPQDGKLIYYYEKENKDIDIRFSTLPTAFGEKVVMRILKPDDSLTNIEALGLIDVNLEKVKEALKSTYGIMLVAGPTGSGKSTTLFGVLKNFNPLNYNISTLEDPIEYAIEYVNQSQIKPEIDYTFASGLRSLVRQDPDIIMVGEIRDKETATLAVEAALTGHLVLSTIHTNSAAGTIQRLINMGVEPFLLASAMKMVISQRLGKRICKDCKAVEEISEVKRKKIKELLSNLMSSEDIDEIVFYKGKGCEKCGGKGYKGRIGIHEVLIVGQFMEDLILEKESANKIKEEAIKHGMITIVQDGLLKAAMGETTVEEALKLI